MKKTRFILGLFLIASTLNPAAAQENSDPQGGQLVQGQHPVNPPAGILVHYSVSKQTPEEGKAITLNLHFENTNSHPCSGTVRLCVQDTSGRKLLDESAELSLKPGAENLFSYDATLPSEGLYPVTYSFTDTKGARLQGSFEWKTEPVNFFYAFGTPHRLTVAMPDSSDKTLFDVEPGKFTLLWTFDDLNFYPYDSFREIAANWKLTVEPQLDGKPFATSTWTRTKGYLPVMENRYERNGVSLLFEAVGGKDAAIIRITLTNDSKTAHQVRIPVTCLHGMYKGPNPGWIDSTLATDHLVAGWNAPADQILIQGIGADSYPVDTVKPSQMNMDWTLAPGETKIGWMVRPYNSFERNNDQQRLRTADWNEAFHSAVACWERLLDRTSRIILPDSGVRNAYRAGLADIFIMREPVGNGYLSIVPGTSGYRSGPNVFESAIATIALNQAGLHSEAETGYRINWDLQTSEGDWTEPYGWCHLMWGGAGYKAWTLFEHFANTRDTTFLEKRFPQLLANSRWQNLQREKTRKLNADGTRPLTWGLMPQGMGDGGLYNDGSYYGIFYTHNIWTVYADSIAYRTALILGKEREATELKQLLDTSRSDLMIAIEKGAIRDERGRAYLTSIPGKATGTGSCWGLLSLIYPSALLPENDSLMTNTIDHYVRKLSPGGLPIHTGWMADGMWVAITLNDFAEVHLMRDESDKANAYLYAVLNHGTPFYSWCEERGVYPGTQRRSGDLQHLWTPTAVARFIRDMLVMEQGDTLHLGRGIARGWMAKGEVGIEAASTRFGDLSYRMHYDTKRKTVIGEITLADLGAPVPTILHCPLPAGAKIVRSSVGTPLADGSGIVLSDGRGTIRFEAKVK